MVIIQGRFATYGALWLDEEVPPRPGVDILLLTNQPCVAHSRYCTPFLTLVNDLALPEDRLFAGLRRTVRYEIRRAGERDDFTYRFIEEPASHLDAFCSFYDRFAATKAIHYAYRPELVAACAAGRLVLSVVEHDGASIVWHGYITTRRSVMLLYSASPFRDTADAEARARVARANRWSHWQDMLNFKGRGFRWFDWGGLFSDESRPDHAHVNAFKRAFGGTPRQNCECKVPITLRGRAALALIALADNLKSRRTHP